MSFSKKIFVAVYGICIIYMCTRLISEEHKRLCPERLSASVQLSCFCCGHVSLSLTHTHAHTCTHTHTQVWPKGKDVQLRLEACFCCFITGPLQSVIKLK